MLKEYLLLFKLVSLPSPPLLLPLHEFVINDETQWAKAGWYFKPGNEEDEKDNCVCPYCERAVAMLEPGDDPLYVLPPAPPSRNERLMRSGGGRALHCRKAGVHCPFFLAPGEEQEGHEKVEIPDKVTSLAVGNGGKTGNGRSKKIRVEPVLVGEVRSSIPPGQELTFYSGATN